GVLPLHGTEEKWDRGRTRTASTTRSCPGAAPKASASVGRNRSRPEVRSEAVTTRRYRCGCGCAVVGIGVPGDRGVGVCAVGDDVAGVCVAGVPTGAIGCEGAVVSSGSRYSKSAKVPVLLGAQCDDSCSSSHALRYLPRWIML